MQVPKYFDEDLFSVLGDDGRPDHRWLIMGPPRSGSTFHKDPNATSAWNAVVTGSKKWILYPPHILPPGAASSGSCRLHVLSCPLLCCAVLQCIAVCCVVDQGLFSGYTSCWEHVGVHASDDGADVACPVSLIEWFLNFYKDTQKGPVRPLEGICRAGEVLFVPRGWWHMAMNLEVGHMSL